MPIYCSLLYSQRRLRQSAHVRSSGVSESMESLFTRDMVVMMVVAWHGLDVHVEPGHLEPRGGRTGTKVDCKG